jgi:nanoRNase/pAp phosphatase (c-di-AMP/oligoRNAs hydrolase)
VTEGEETVTIAKKYGGGGHRNAAGFRVRLLGLGHFDV